MEMIYHVHLTKMDFENNDHLQLTKACFMHLLMLSPENIHILKIMTVGEDHNEKCMDGSKLELQN